MIIADEKHLLFIEPKNPASPEPVIDEFTRMMTAAFLLSKREHSYRGWHTCLCGADSSNCDHVLPSGVITNSLCIHYLAYHRDEVPQAELEKVSRLNLGEEVPDASLLRKPGKKFIPEKPVYRS